MRIRRRKIKLGIIIGVVICLAVAAIIAYQPDSWLRRASDDWQRQNDYDAYLARHVQSLLAQGRFRGLTPSGTWAECVYLGLSGILPRQGNSRYAEWDYVCVASVDGRYLRASRPWNTWLWEAYFAAEERGEDLLINFDPDDYAAELYRVDLCVPRDELAGHQQFTLSIIKARTSGDTSITPIDSDLGWENFDQHELVAEFTVPVPDEVTLP